MSTDVGRPQPAPSTVDKALTALIVTGDNAVKASALCGTPDRTIRTWRDKYHNRYQELRAEHAPAIEQQLIHEYRSFVVEASNVKRLALQETERQITAGELKDASTAVRNLATAEAIAVDKMLLIDGRPTSITETKTADDALRELAKHGLVIDSTADELDT